MKTALSVNHALESYGSGRGFIIACEKSRRIVCNDHSSQPYKVHMTDSNENRAKRLESVVWKYQLLWSSHFFWMNRSCSPYSIRSPFTWIIYAKIKTQNSKINWNTISDTIMQTSLSRMKQRKYEKSARRLEHIMNMVWFLKALLGWGDERSFKVYLKNPAKDPLFWLSLEVLM